MKPNQIKNTILESQSSTLVISGLNNAFYPTYDAHDPYPAQYRGYYFNGNAYMKIYSFNLAPKFTIAMWINPSAGTSTLITKQTDDSSVSLHLNLSITGFFPRLILKLEDGASVSYTSTSTLDQYQWNLLTVSSYLTATPAQAISFSINSASDGSLDLSTSS